MYLPPQQFHSLLCGMKRKKDWSLTWLFTKMFSAYMIDQNDPPKKPDSAKNLQQSQTQPWKKVCADNQIYFLISLSHLIRRLLFKKAETSDRNKCRICILINSGITWLEQELKLIYFQWAACPGTCSSNCTSKNRINRKLFENKGHTPTLPKDVSGYVHPWLRNCKFWNTKREHEQNS